MNIYFSGIGGVGIGPLAEIARDAGYAVQGSDRGESLQFQQLQERGIPVSLNQDGSFLRSCHQAQPIDWFVYTASLPSDHPELILARELGIRTSKRDELIAHIIAEKHLRLIAVAGTHGKTTTTGMLVWAMKQLGIPVSYSVGSTLSFGPSGSYDPKSEYFIYECDEYDRNFLHFHPYLSLVTSIHYDHPDTYPTEADYMTAFQTFTDQSQMTIMWQEDVSNSVQPEKGWILQDDETLAIRLAGHHNRKNATLAAKAIEYLVHERVGEAIEALHTFPGTSRRFERLAENLYSDYAHHPQEIAATLQLARELSDHVVVVYQPHQNIRQYEVKDQYKDCFTAAEKVYWLPTYLSREDPSLPILSPEDLYSNAINTKAFHAADLNDELWQAIESERRDGKLVVAMGAGSIDSWLRDHVANILD